MGRLGLGSVAWTTSRLLLITMGQQKAELVVVEVLVAEWWGLARTHLDSLAPSIEDPGMNPAAFSCFALIYDDLHCSNRTSSSQ